MSTAASAPATAEEGSGARGRGARMARTPSWAPNDNVTVIKSRPVQYLLMKLRDRNTVGRVREILIGRLTNVCIRRRQLQGGPSCCGQAFVDIEIRTAF